MIHSTAIVEDGALLAAERQPLLLLQRHGLRKEVAAGGEDERRAVRDLGDEFLQRGGLADDAVA